MAGMPSTRVIRVLLRAARVIKTMFTLEIRINGTMLVHVYGHNEGEINDANQTKYRYELYRLDSREVVNGEVWHYRHEGIEPLIASILMDVKKGG